MGKLNHYYAQNGEDYILTQFFDEKSHGFFIDIGAFDGIHLSNSFSFERQGWNGLCIEPQIDYYKMCLKNRPASICVHAACVDSPDIVSLEISTDATGLFSGTQLSDKQKNIQDHYNVLGVDIPPATKETVPAITLNNILSDNDLSNVKIDFLSVDVEGMEIDVLNGFALEKYRPTILVIETTTDDEQSKISQYLEKFEYYFARRVGPNSFFAKNRDDCEKLKSIELTCVIDKQIHPHGEPFTPPDYLKGKVLYKGQNAWSLLSQHEYLSERLIERNEKVKSLLNMLEEKNSIIKKLKAMTRRIIR